MTKPIVDGAIEIAKTVTLPWSGRTNAFADFEKLCARDVRFVTLDHQVMDVLASEVLALRAHLTNIIGVVEAHELQSLDCDRRGDEYCECLSNAIALAKKRIE